jgi:D-galactarolactone cycloisomerase
MISRMRATGHRAFKIKVGFGEETDLGSLRPAAKSL